ncbi:MAG: hypothetical protein M1814_001974 [Vezdaea aestivalis]|nr:MAG: hypothetical protein M1814_001974 [Vezdaea aestivalis]
MLVLLSFLFALSPLVSAHTDHAQEPLAADAQPDWALQHMIEEHHIQNFDPRSFFILHDYDESGSWTGPEIQRTYGLDDESHASTPFAKRDEVARTVLDLLDLNGDSHVSLEEWEAFCAKGGKLPDLGTGPGHHGDDEYEYEIHHFEKYHDENTKYEDLTHPEDIAHFAKHEAMEKEEEMLEAREKLKIIEANIPMKFRA